MVMSRDKNAGQNSNTERDNKSFENVEYSRYSETTLKNPNCIHKEIKSRLKSGNACYHSVQNLLPPSLLFKNIKIKTQIYNSACCFVWVSNLVDHIEGGM